jgi:hypothetical protein
MKYTIVLLLSVLGFTPVFAATCEGGLYQNPVGMRGGGGPIAGVATETIKGLIMPSGISVSVVRAVKEVGEVRTLLKSTTPCWLYGNPVFGSSLGKNYEPLVVNMDPIESGVLIFGKAGSVKSPLPKSLDRYSATEQSEALRLLKTIRVIGMAGGVTSAMVYGSGLIDPSKFEGLPPKIGGIGQRELPQVVAMNWVGPVAIVGRYDSLLKVSVTDMQVVRNPDVYNSELVVIPGPKSPGYGLYVHTSIDPRIRSNLIRTFETITTPNKELRTALDTDEKPEFKAVRPGEMSAIEKTIAPYIK